MRVQVIKIVLCLCLIAVVVRLFYWQVIRKDDLVAAGEGQYLKSVKVAAQRGKIFFSDGSVLASTQPSFTLFAEPKVIKDDDKGRIAQDLAKTISQDQNDILSQLKKDLFWVPIKKNIDLSLKKNIEALKIKGIGFEKESLRFYPEGSSSAHLLGFVGYSAKGERVGYFGLEGFYNGELKGFAGRYRFEKDALGLPILIGQFINFSPVRGKNLFLNIDRTAQFIMEKNLKAGIEKYGAKGALGLIMDPGSGAILAMAAYPNYDPLEFGQFPKEYYKNPLIADQYEPGSTFKVLVMSAALNEDVIKSDTKCDICAGPISLGGFLIRTWNNKYFPETSMQDVIVHSDNTGMVYVGKKLGLDKMYSYLENFGLGSLTGIDLQDESLVDLRPKNSWREIDLATTSFGQGIAVTPIQMIRAVAAVANGGYLMEPQVVKKIEDERISFEIKPKVIREVIKETTAKIMTEMMVRAVSEGEAKFAKPKGFKIAGKTGTAQIPIAGHYDPNKTIASFVGFAPADNPKFVMLIKYDHPQTSPYGSETAAPTFFEIAKELFAYYKIAPSE